MHLVAGNEALTSNKRARGSKGARAEKAANGISLNRNAQAVYDALLGAQTPRKAYALLEQLHDRGLKSPMTIYRALDELMERGLARKIASLNAFVAVRQQSAGTPMAFVTCKRCGATREIPINPQRVEDLFGVGAIGSGATGLGDVFIEAFGECHSEGCDAK